MAHRRDQDEVDLQRLDAGRLQAAAAARRRVVDDRLAGGGVAALVDAGAADDPVLGHAETRGDRRVVDHRRRNGRRDAADDPRREALAAGLRRSESGRWRVQARAASGSRSTSASASSKARPIMRASVLPGPASTNRRTPIACRASSVSRQRTGRTSAAASWSRIRSAVAPKSVGEDARKHGRLRRLDLDLAERLAEGLHRRLHRRGVEGTAHRELDRAQAVGLRGLLRSRRAPRAARRPRAGSGRCRWRRRCRRPSRRRGRGRRRRAAPASRRAGRRRRPASGGREAPPSGRRRRGQSRRRPPAR